MKQARRWLLLAAALVLLPQAANAQKKKPKGATPTAPAGDTPAAPADMDADQPTAPAAAPTAPPAGADTAAPPAAADTGAPSAAGESGAMDVCQITPDAPQCQAAKEVNLNVEAKKTVRAEVYAVQQQYVIKAHRFEIQPYFAITLNDQFVSHDAPGLSLNYYITQVLAIGVNGNWYGSLNEDSTSTSRIAERRASVSP